MFIYQIGDQILRGYASISSNVSFSDTSYMSDSNNRIYFNSRFQKLEPVQINVSGELYIYNNTTPYKQLSDLISVAGKPYVDIIGYMPSEYKFGYNEINFNNSDVDDARWFYTYGQVLSVDRTMGFEEDHNTSMPLNVTIAINPVWIPLNEWVWYAEYELSNIKTVTQIPITLEKSVLPREVVDFNYAPHFRFYKRGLYDGADIELYTNSTNTIWQDWLSDKTMFKHVNQTVSTSPNIITLETTTDNNYPPYIIYKFSGDDSWITPPQITITVESELQPMKFTEFETTFALDLPTGQHLIIPCDSPHFIVNDNNTIIKNNLNGENASIEMLYETPYPAILLGKYNRITIESTQNVDCQVLLYNRAL